MLPVVTLPRGKRVMLADDDFLGVGAGLLQLLLEPVQRLAGILRAVAQPVEKLRGEGRVARMRRVVGEDFAVALVVGRRKHAVGDLVGDLAHLAGAVHADRDAAEIFDQHEAQQRRQRPELADLHRLDRLEPLDHRFESMRGDRAVGMRDIDPGERQRARHRGAVGQRHRRQLAVEAARQVALDLEDGLLDQIVVVEQPLRGRRHHFAARLRGVGRAVDVEDFRRVLAYALLEIERLQPEKRRDFVAAPGFRPAPLAGLHAGIALE